MPENTNQQKVVTLEAMAAVAPLLVTKTELTEEVRKQIAELPQEGIGLEFATTEEILALFQDNAQSEDQDDTPDTSGE